MTDRRSSNIPLLKLEQVLILGASGVGKTSLLSRFVDDTFTNKYKATIGADFKVKDVLVNDTTAKLQIWDTAGQERFQSLGQAFYRGADICILVFDITKTDSFEAIDSWRDEFIAQVPDGEEDTFPVAVIGNKLDLQAQRTVPRSRALNWCASKGSGMEYFETSAKDNSNVQNVFKSLSQKALLQHNRSAVRFRPDPSENILYKEKSSMCC